MLKYHSGIKEIIAAELIDKNYIIREPSDAVDLLAEAGQHECSSLIIPAANFDRQFFDLKTGIAGEILQKFSNYRVRLAITGDFTGYKSKSLRDFIRECNRGGFIIFCDDTDFALNKFGSI